jgi:hypothetical protein
MVRRDRVVNLPDPRRPDPALEDAGRNKGDNGTIITLLAGVRC